MVAVALIELLLVNCRCNTEGRIRDHVFTNNSWRDSELYSVLVNEWRSAPV